MDSEEREVFGWCWDGLLLRTSPPFVIDSFSLALQCAMHRKMGFPRQRSLTAKMLFALFALAVLRFYIFGFLLTKREAANLALDNDEDGGDDGDSDPRVVPTPTRQPEYTPYKPSWDEGDSPLKGKGKKSKGKGKSTKVEVSTRLYSIGSPRLTRLTEQGHRP